MSFRRLATGWTGWRKTFVLGDIKSWVDGMGWQVDSQVLWISKKFQNGFLRLRMASEKGDSGLVWGTLSRSSQTGACPALRFEFFLFR